MHDGSGRDGIHSKPLGSVDHPLKLDRYEVQTKPKEKGVQSVVNCYIRGHLSFRTRGDSLYPAGGAFLF